MSETDNTQSKSLSACIEDVLSLIELRKNAKFNDRDIPTGLKQLDAVIYGWQPGELIVLGARPGMGKSSLLRTMAYNISSLYNIPIAMFPLEYNAEETTFKLLSLVAEMNLTKIQKGLLQPHEVDHVNEGAKKLAELPIYINDTASSLEDISESIRNEVNVHKVKVVMIDTLQLIRAEGGKIKTREEGIAHTLKNLKLLARELNIVLILTSQLSRAVESRGGDKRPMLSDLRESGAIEQDATKVLFIYRPEYYGIDMDENGDSMAGIAEIIIAKNRSGPVDNIRLKFIANYTLFTDLPETEFIDSFSFASMRKGEF